MKKIGSSKIMKKYIISIPKVVREILGIEPGDYIEWFIDGDRIVIEKRGKYDEEIN